MKRTLIAGIATLMAIAQAHAKEAPKYVEPAGLDTRQATISFLNQDAVLDWQADGINGLWIQDRGKQWYYATMFAPCFGLDFAVGIGFKNRGGMNRLDRDSEVIVPDSGHCAFSSLRKSSMPPPEHKRKSDKDKAK